MSFLKVVQNYDFKLFRISLCLISSVAFLVYKLVQKFILSRQETASIWDENYKNGWMSSSVDNSTEKLNSQQLLSILKNPNAETGLNTGRDFSQKTANTPD